MNNWNVAGPTQVIFSRYDGKSGILYAYINDTYHPHEVQSIPLKLGALTTLPLLNQQIISEALHHFLADLIQMRKVLLLHFSKLRKRNFRRQFNITLNQTIYTNSLFHMLSPSHRLERGRRHTYVILNISACISIKFATMLIKEANGYADANRVTYPNWMMISMQLQKHQRYLVMDSEQSKRHY